VVVVEADLVLLRLVMTDAQIRVRRLRKRIRVERPMLVLLVKVLGIRARVLVAGLPSMNIPQVSN
jgi:hypothetical protein